MLSSAYFSVADLSYLFRIQKTSQFYSKKTRPDDVKFVNLARPTVTKVCQYVSKGRFRRYNFVACDVPKTGVVSSKSNLQLNCDFRRFDLHGTIRVAGLS